MARSGAITTSALAQAGLQTGSRGVWVRGLRPYDLRHSFASVLIHEGKPLMEIAEQLGHSVETLLRHYAHLIAEMAGEPPIPAEQAILDARVRLDAAARS